MAKILVILLGIGIVAFVVFLFLQKDTHVSHITIERDYDTVWKWISNPLKYGEIYPNWVKTGTAQETDTYLIDDQFGNHTVVKRAVNKELGVIDLLIGNEISRTRLMKTGDTQTTVVHLAKRWKGVNPLICFFTKSQHVKTLRTRKN